MKVWKKRVISLAAVSCMLVTALSGCADKGTEDKDSSKGDAGTAKATTWADNTTPVDIDVYLDASWCAMDIWGTDAASKTVTKETGINLKIEKPAADDAQRISMLISSDDLPDLIIMDKNNAAWEQMIIGKQLSKMNELIDEYAPALKTAMDPTILANNQYTDGNVYRIPNFIETPNYKSMAQKYNGLVGANQSTLLIRQDYLAEIGNPVIKNKEEFTDAITKLKALHPDKIGFYAGSLKEGPKEMNHHFGIAPYYLDGNTLKHNIDDPKTKELLMWMYDLSSKGLLTKETFVDETEVASGKVKQGLPIAFRWTLGEAGKVPDDNPNTTYEAMEPWDTYKQVRTGTGWFAVGIPVKSEKADRVIQLLEYTNSEPGYKALCYGIEGDTFKNVEEGAHYKVVDGQPRHLQAYTDAKAADWGGVEQKTGLGPHQMLVLDKAYSDLPTWDPNNEMMTRMNATFGPRVEYQPKLDINFVAGSEELVTKTKIEELIKEYTVKIVFASSKEEAEKEFNTLLEKADEAGKENFDKYITAQYNK